MNERGRDHRLVTEASERFVVDLLEQLDRDASPAEIELEALVHDSHPTGAELALDPVATSEHLADRIHPRGISTRLRVALVRNVGKQ